MNPDAHRFLLGCAVDPFKRLERDLVPQYLKLAMKARAGADYAITQVGYDAHRSDQLLRWMRRAGIDRPVVANAYILSAPVARAFNAGRVPGCVVPDDLLAVAEREAASPDKGRAFFLEFAAKQLVVSRGLGFRGIYLSGHRDAAEIGRVLELADAHDPADWRSLVRDVSWALPGGFQPFEPDGHGLSTDELGRAYAASLAPAARKRARRGVDAFYKVNRALHARVFEPGSPGFRAWAGIYGKVEQLHVEKPLHVMEQAAKLPMFDCRDCGDCSLPDIAYLCPESHCQKNQRNGPCGGAHDGLCEVPGHTCVWSDAYRRLKPYGEELSMLDRAPVVQDNALRRTSAWGNTFLGRDHYAAATSATPAIPAVPAKPATSASPATRATPAATAVLPRHPRARERTQVVRPDRTGTPFLVVGENIHATRILKRAGRHAAELPDGSVGIGFEGPDGARLVLPVHPSLVAARDFGQGKIKHVASAIRWGLEGGDQAGTAAAYIQVLAARQERTGADWLDLNADEIASDSETRARGMTWLVETVEATAGVPVSIDSSDVAVLAAGVAASTQPRGRLLLNSASIERPEVLDLAAVSGCAVILAASSAGGMPADAGERVANAAGLIEAAIARGIPAERLFVDPLVLPVAVAPEAPGYVLEAARRLRAEYGDAIHLTGGLSNVSFGMPERRLLNDTFIDLAAEAGIDSGIIDPVASDLARVFGADRGSEPYRLAADMLLGRDPFGGEYVLAFREGRLGGNEG